MPSVSENLAFQELLATISGQAVVAVQALWKRYANSDSRTRWDALQSAYPQILDPFLSSAELITAEWYDNLNPNANFAVEIPDPIKVSALEANVRWALTTLDPLSTLSGSAERQVFNASRQTTYYNMRRENVRYARLASPDACGFCMVLSTRTTDDDGLYLSEESATTVVGRGGRPRGSRDLGEEYHDNCKCVPIPIRGDEEYEPPEYVQQWQEQYENADGSTMNDKANALRREAYPDRKDSLNARRRELYAQKTATEDAANTD